MMTTMTTSTIALAAAGGYCIAWISVESAETIEARLAAAHLPHDEVVAHHLGDDQHRAERDAGLGKRDDDVAHDLPAARAGVARGLDHARIDLGERVGDRADHQEV